MSKSLFDIYKKIAIERKAQLNEQTIINDIIEKEREKRRKEWRINNRKNEVVGFVVVSQSQSSSSSAGGSGGGGGNRNLSEGNLYVEDDYIDDYFV